MNDHLTDYEERKISEIAVVITWAVFGSIGVACICGAIMVVAYTYRYVMGG